MRLELVSITTDTFPLDGLFYEPEGGATAGAVMLLHGNCLNFYSGPPRFLPPYLVELGYACLAFNRRGHDVVVTPTARTAGGGAYQTAAEAVADNEYASRWLRARGFGAPVVIGHSNGGMLSVRHVADNPDTPAMVLLSAHLGGRHIVPKMCDNGLFALDRLDEYKELAARMIAEGRGRQLITLPGWWHVITAETLIDYSTETPDTMEMAPKITCPSLYIVGDKERPDIYPAEAFARKTTGHCTAEIFPDCDHFYTGREDPVARRVAGWLKATLG